MANTRAGKRIKRFTRTERAAHWLLAATFFVMLFTGLCLSVSAFEGLLDRPTAKAWHLWSAVALIAGLVLIALLGNRRALARSAGEMDRFDGDDGRWLKSAPGRVWNGGAAPPQGRFNAGQKLNLAVTLGLLIVLGVSGVLLWLGERDTTYRYAGSVHVHDLATLAITFLICGHLYLALLHPATSAALPGMTNGSVDREWARRHHGKWVEEAEAAEAASGAAEEAADAALPAPLDEQLTER
jgi:formate dehydrogenase subunit gamma